MLGAQDAIIPNPKMVSATGMPRCKNRLGKIQRGGYPPWIFPRRFKVHFFILVGPRQVAHIEEACSQNKYFLKEKRKKKEGEKKEGGKKREKKGEKKKREGGKKKGRPQATVPGVFFFIPNNE